MCACILLIQILLKEYFYDDSEGEQGRAILTTHKKPKTVI